MFRLIFYILAVFIILSCNCMGKYLPPKPPADKNLKELVLIGAYFPKDIEDETKRRQKKYENCVWYWKGMGHSNKKAMRYCGDELTEEEDELKTKDSFLYSGINYCYNEVKDKDPIYDKKLVARLYDKQGKILAEDYVRCDRDLDGTANCDKQDSPEVTIYLPYHDSAKELHIVSFKEKKEFIVYKRNVLSQSFLTDTDSPTIIHSYTYDKEFQCFIAPPIK